MKVVYETEKKNWPLDAALKYRYIYRKFPRFRVVNFSVLRPPREIAGKPFE